MTAAAKAILSTCKHTAKYVQHLYKNSFVFTLFAQTGTTLSAPSARVTENPALASCVDPKSQVDPECRHSCPAEDCSRPCRKTRPSAHQSKIAPESAATPAVGAESFRPEVLLRVCGPIEPCGRYSFLKYRTAAPHELQAFKSRVAGETIECWVISVDVALGLLSYRNRCWCCRACCRSLLDLSQAGPLIVTSKTSVV